MKIIEVLCCVIFTINSFTTYSQEYTKIVISDQNNWNKFKEGESKSIQLSVNDDSTNYQFFITQGKQLGMQLAENGLFEWKPPFEFVDRIEKTRLIQLIIEAKSDSGKVINQTIELIVSHENRTPIVNELKPFYIKYNTSNSYQIDKNVVFDPDNDPIAIIPSLEDLPEGMNISTVGLLTWNPSYTQFKQLKEKPIFITYFVEDQPSKSKTEGKIKLVATQLDLPPDITVIPNVEKIKIKENETLNLRFYLSDPNGEDDIDTFDYISNLERFPKNLLSKNTRNQYEFTWNPTYKFVVDPLDSLSFSIDFFVLDKTQKRALKHFDIVVQNTLNQEEEDLKQYYLYRGTLQRAWELLEQLKEKEKELKQVYNKAKKGKKQRSVINAGLGATTGLSSIISRDKEDLRRNISTIGGTTVLTIGTLEATEVIGRSTKDIIDRLNYIIEKRNDIQTKGDIFARDYSLKSTRRTNDFTRNMDDFMKSLQLKGLVALELDATWEPKVKSTEKAIQQTFKDFVIEKTQ